MSNLHRWDDWYVGLDEPTSYGDTLTYGMAAEWLDGLEVEDWGAGKGYFSTLIPAKLYRGLDGSQTPFADEVVDLCDYTSSVDGVLLRHVLEHNDDWRSVLTNALRSARRRMVVVLFTPMSDETKEIARSSEIDVPDISFSHDELMSYFSDFVVEWSDHVTATQYGVERVYLLERR